VNDQRGGRDPELEDLFEAPEDREVAREVRQFLRSTSTPAAGPDPEFQANLRRRLLEDAWRRQQAPPPWYRRVLGPRRLGAVGALAAAFVIALVATTHGSPSQGVQVTSPLEGSQRVSVVQPVTLMFDQPMDRRSTEAAVAIQPATPVTYRWTSPQTLEIVPASGSLAPATRYEVTVQPSARTADQRPLSREVEISFVTAQPGATPAQGPSAGPTPSTSPSPTATPSPSPTPTPTPSVSPSPSASPSPSTSPPTSAPPRSPGSSPSPPSPSG
jgi:hypothetical protein